MLERFEDVTILDHLAIGEGAFSKVVRCKLKNDPRTYALKIVRLQDQLGEINIC